jgi:hypothetical protein
MVFRADLDAAVAKYNQSSRAEAEERRIKGVTEVARKRAEGLAELQQERIRMLAAVAEERAKGTTEVAKGLAQVARKRGELHHEIEGMHEHKKTQQGRVELNIGGFKYTTSVETLRRVPSTFFDACFSGRYPQDVCADGSIFIDRDGEHFSHILEYMRDGVMAVVELKSAEQDVSVLRWLKREFGFYCIDFVAKSKEETVYAVGGTSCIDYRHVLASLERLESASGAWRQVAPMHTERTSFGLCSVGEDLYAIGGMDKLLYKGLGSMERYIPSIDMWGYAPPMPGYGERYRPGDVLHDMCTVVVGNTIYVLGGIARQRYNKANPTSSVLKFDCGTQSWSEGTPMPEGRNAAATCVLGLDMYIIGGHDESDPLDMRPTSTTLCFNTETEQWVTLAPMPDARYSHSASALDGLGESGRRGP